MELKFRAWFKEKETYIEPMTIQKMIHQKVNEFSLRQLNDWFIFEQYIGLKDKDNVELYINDIIEICWSDELGETRYSTVIVKNPFDYDLEELSIINYANEIKYLGNIHENKELLY